MPLSHTWERYVTQGTFQKLPVLQVLVSKTTINMRLKIILSILVWLERVNVLEPVPIWLNVEIT